MAKGHTSYCGLVRGPHVIHKNKWNNYCLNYCEIFIACTQFKNVAAGCRFETHSFDFQVKPNSVIWSKLVELVELRASLS
jgi:hypothetical protein